MVKRGVVSTVRLIDGLVITDIESLGIESSQLVWAARITTTFDALKEK